MENENPVLGITLMHGEIANLAMDGGTFANPANEGGTEIGRSTGM